MFDLVFVFFKITFSNHRVTDTNVPKPELILGVKTIFFRKEVISVSKERESVPGDIQIRKKKVGLMFAYVSLTRRLVHSGCLNEVGLPRSLCARKIS